MIRQIIRLQAVIILLLGIVMVFFAVHLGGKLKPEEFTWKSASLLLVQVLGITLFGFAIFSMIVESKNWRDYFAERLKEIVTEQSYLSTLDRATLKNIQISTFKALSRNPDIDKEGTFLRYFHANLHRYISEPYREDVAQEIMVKGEENGRYKFFDKVTYVCRKSGDTIQSEIRWQPDKGEFAEVSYLEAKAQYPYDHDKRGERIDLGKFTGEQLENGAVLSLDKHKDIDRLIVILTSEYTVETDRFQYWQMAHPTKNFDITITYPKGYSIQMKPLVLNPGICQITEEEGYLKVRYNSWMLPMSGLAWRLTRKS